MIWTKARTVAYDHGLYDSVRGGGSLIYPSLSQAASTVTNGIQSFDADGVTFGANNKSNASDSTYVAWAWKADDNEPTIFGGPAIAVYKFEDNANDVTGTYNGTASNVSYVTGKFNKAADFNGSSSYINTGLTKSNWVSDLNSRSVDFTISLWANVDAVVGGDNTFLYIGNYNAYSPNYAAMVIDYRSSGSKIRFTHQSTYVESTSTISLDTWYHIVCVRESGVIKLYINGVLENSATPSADMQISSSAVATLGALYFSSTTHGELDGMLDQFRFYSGAVSDIGVAELYAETVSDNDDLELGGPPEILVSANANAGFSIVKYEGTGSAGLKIPHGLSAAPTFIIAKTLESSAKWRVYHSALGGTKYLNLNDSYGAGTSSNVWNNFTPTATVFEVGADLSPSGEQLIAYCFHDVTGYQKLGSYAGNGTSQSINVGFKPDFVMLRKYTSGQDWMIFDSVRDGNPKRKRLEANNSDAEVDETTNINFTSTGFEFTSGYYNDSGQSSIYWAIKIN